MLVPSQGTASGTLSVALALLITMLVFGGAALLALLIAWWGGPEGPPNGPEQTE
ncbi:MAG: hypothetical protein HY683_00230 [Chloroflexi bacterium]|nr:hypothetical protein [Chloroflexota bacterium]